MTSPDNDSEPARGGVASAERPGTGSPMLGVISNSLATVIERLEFGLGRRQVK